MPLGKRACGVADRARESSSPAYPPAEPSTLLKGSGPGLRVGSFRQVRVAGSDGSSRARPGSSPARGSNQPSQVSAQGLLALERLEQGLEVALAERRRP